MRLTYSDEQEEFRGVVRRFLEDHSPPGEVRALMETDAGYDAEVWRRLGEELGVPGLHLPEAYGGQAFSPVEQGIVLQEMGRALLCAPYFGSIVLAANAVQNAASEAEKKEILPGLASGETIGALAFCEPEGHWDAEGVSLGAAPCDGGYRLDGVKSYVVDGAIADLVVVVGRRPGSRGEDGLSFFVVRGDAPGLERQLLSSLDPTRKLARLRFAGVRAELIGEEGAGAPALARTLDLAAVALANEMAGGAEKVLETTVEYAKTRVQFGRQIGSFQAIKHKCADMLLEVELAKSTAIYAAASAAEESDDLPEVAPLAKAFVSDAYRRATAESIQIHGGLGFTWEHDCHLYFKRARSSALLLGDANDHRERMARHLELWPGEPDE
ncbi:MAG: acyl-CoA dehydrogenase family protein [Myxococcota bacterium]|nr:acyl-CoA dehydrogenase family protein [Myxococcota bacterium]